MFKGINLEFLTYFSLASGFILDHVTTIFGINYYQVYETNSIVINLLDLGLWSIVDSIICISLIMLLKISINKHESLKFLLFLPLLAGIIRLMIGFSNLSLLL